ncbi:hypothetical protein [Streptomyces sp. Qhu_M48]|uniref:hypothetical protein n=1 Tax=Streptomyces sp. Qhu_M48 TaxID=3435889 RepID=UPI003F50CB93
MSRPLHGHPGDTRGKRPTGYLATIAALTGVGLLIDMFAFYISVFATDSCGPANPALVCTTSGMLWLWALPWIGLGVGAAVAAGLGLAAWRRGRTPWMCLPLGVALYVGSLAGAWMIMVS